MERGLYIAASGMLAELIRQDQIANDLANASTPGYKPDRSAQGSFGDLLLANSASGAVVGPIGLGAQIQETVTDMTQGGLRQTDEPLDVALEGEGFLAVLAPEGVRYTRNGQLALDGQGRLVTATGYTVLGEDGNPITVGAQAGATVDADGTVRSNGRAVGRLAVVSLPDAAKQGDSLFAGTAGARPDGTSVRQGFLEASGVNATRAMVDMLVSLRAFEASQRVVRAIDETLGRGINSIQST
jgi:flagellar basal-body rod protein FlgF